MGREHWVETNLANVVFNKKGKKPKVLKEKPFAKSSPYINIEAFETGLIKQYADNESSNLCYSNDVLVVWDGARFGLTGFRQSGAIGSTLACLTPIIIESTYLQKFIQSNYSTIQQKPKGMATPHVDPDLFWNLQFPLPPLNEQKRIVDKLDALLPKVKSAKARLEKIPVILKKFRQSVLTQACSGKLTKDWREGKELPEWEEKDFFNFFILQRGYDLVLSKLENGKYPVITSAGISGYHNQKKAKAPGVVTGRSGSVGRVYYIESDFWPHNTTLFVKDFKNNLPKYVYYFLLGFDITQYSSSTAVPTLNRNNLRNISVVVPSLEEQQEIVRRVEKLFALAESIEANYTKAYARVVKIEQSILAKAFRGELVEPDPRDEPAEELLKRILEEKAKLNGEKKKRKAIEKNLEEN